MKQFAGCILAGYLACRLTDSPSMFGVQVASALYALWLSYLYVQFRRNCTRVSHIPGRGGFLLTPFASIASLVLPHIPGVNVADFWGFFDAERTLDRTYKRFNTTISSVVGFSHPAIYLSIADPVALKHILSNKTGEFPKHTDIYFAILVFGQSLIISEGETFRRHRKIVTAAFGGEATLRLGWKESTKVVNQWIKDLRKRAAESKDGTATEDSIVTRCLSVALYVICSSAFGVRVPMPGEPPVPAPANHPYSFHETVAGALNELFTIMLVPQFLRGWFPSKRVQRAFLLKKGLEDWITEIISQRRAEMSAAQAEGEQQQDEGTEKNAEVRQDLLSLLVKSNDEAMLDDNPQHKGYLNSEEVLANVWLFLLAGHETSSNTLAYALSLLAIYPEEQDKLFAEIVEVSPDLDAELPYSLYPQFKRATAIVNETLRLFPVAYLIPKMVAAQHGRGGAEVPTTERGPLGGKPVWLPDGAKINVDVLSVHHDPDNWPNPEQFNPSRFIDTDEYEWNRDAFIPFSGGTRSCTGQQFARVELVCMLVNLCRSFRIRLHPESESGAVKGETQEEKRKRVLRSVGTLTLCMDKKLKLQFQPR